MIRPVFVEKPPAGLYAPDFLDYAAALAERPGAWALWPHRDMGYGYQFQFPGQVITADLGDEGPSGRVHFTRREGQTYVWWTPA